VTEAKAGVPGEVRSDPDGSLLQSVLAGDRKAFELLVGRYQSKVYRLAMGLTHNSQDAEEIIQEVFFKVYRNLAEFEGKSAFSSWLYRIALNTSYMKLRERRGGNLVSLDDVINQLEEQTLDHESDWSSRPDDQLHTSEAMAIIEKAVEKLPEEFKSVLILRDIEGFTNEEAGEILELSVPAVKSRLHRARLLLRQRLNEFYRQVFE
jgi:RNA polymerase sigma-70 factor (ECF subfamily)